MWSLDTLISRGAAVRRPFVLCALAALAAGITVIAGEGKPSQKADDIQTLLEKAEVVRGEQRPFAKPDTKQKPTTLSDEEIRRIAEYYRGQYPFESLRKRLSYEQRLAEDRPKPKLSETATARLKQQDDPQGLMESRRAYGGTFRAKSLSMLHSDEVRKFITQEGFGITRFGPPSPGDLELPEVEPIAFDRPPVLSAAHLDNKPVPPPAREPDYTKLLGDWSNIPEKEHEQVVQQRYDRWTMENNPLRMPTWPRLIAMHEDSSDSFASRWRNGLVKDVDRVAGFAPHALAFMPRVRMAAPRRRWAFSHGEDQEKLQSKRIWQVSRMQLMSLLKHETPGVYRSDRLPKMKELANAKTRPLDEFEAAALKRLRHGEDIVTRSRTNRILMLGSLRAAKRCLDCHDVHRGELLGAFSYELTRKKPIVVLSKPIAQRN
jgi:hypothetical protein